MKQSPLSVRRRRIYALCECALMLALAVALSYVKFLKLPFDGSVTAASMLPICLIALRHGTAWGLGTAFCFSWFQMLQGGVFGWGLTPFMLIASLVLDYILAYTVLGLCGLFRKRGTVMKIVGIACVCAFRFLVHFLSGILLWANLEEFIAFGRAWVGRPVLYSICYNGVYMLPETAITVAVAILLFRVPQFKRLMEKDTVGT